MRIEGVEVWNGNHFGGYAKTSPELIAFINEFKTNNNISLDPIYTGKMMYALFDKISNNHFKEGSKILAIHTGGLQGVVPHNLLNKNKPELILH